MQCIIQKSIQKICSHSHPSHIRLFWVYLYLTCELTALLEHFLLQLILPDAMKVFPVYMNSLLKTPSLVGSTELSTDDRAFYRFMVMAMGVEETQVLLYPRLIPLVSYTHNMYIVSIINFKHCALQFKHLLSLSLSTLWMCPVSQSQLQCAVLRSGSTSQACSCWRTGSLCSSGWDRPAHLTSSRTSSMCPLSATWTQKGYDIILNKTHQYLIS